MCQKKHQDIYFILFIEGIFVDSQLYPNLTYDTLFGSKWTVEDNIKRKEQKYEKK